MNLNEYQKEIKKILLNAHYQWLEKKSSSSNILDHYSEELSKYLNKKITINEYQKRVQDTWITNEFDLERFILGICGESGEIAELFKKIYRGDYDNQTELIKEKLEKEIGDVIYYLAQLCNYHDLVLEDILQKNIDKLAKRKEEGKIRGSGDNR